MGPEGTSCVMIKHSDMRVGAPIRGRNNQMFLITAIHNQPPQVEAINLHVPNIPLKMNREFRLLARLARRPEGYAPRQTWSSKSMGEEATFQEGTAL